MNAGLRGVPDPRTTPKRLGRRLSRALCALGTALLACVLLALGAVVGAPSSVSGVPVARAGAAIAATDSPTATPSATSTPAPVNPGTFSLVSPSSGQGPVGAHVTVSGGNWTNGQVMIGAAQPGSQCGAPSSWSTKFGNSQPDGSGNFSFTLVWPTSLASVNSQYDICVNYAGTPTATTPYVPYTVLSSSSPVLSFSASSVQVGQSVTISGANYFGASSILLQASVAGGAPRTLATETAGSDGTFSYTYQPLALDTGTVTISADSTREGNADPALQATAQITVGAAPTATATLQPTATAAAQTHASAPPSDTSNGPNALIIVLVVIILLVLVATAGVIVYMVMRRRNEPPDGDDGNGYPPDGGYGGTGRVPATVPGYGDHDPFAVPGQYGRGGAGGGYAPTPTETMRGAGMGGVAQWDEADRGPGPDWQPRPMTGIRRTGEPEEGFSQYPGASSAFDGFTREDQAQGMRPPADPWAGATSGYPQQPSQDRWGPGQFGTGSQFGPPNAPPSQPHRGADGLAEQGGWDDPWMTRADGPYNPPSQRPDQPQPPSQPNRGQPPRRPNTNDDQGW